MIQRLFHHAYHCLAYNITNRASAEDSLLCPLLLDPVHAVITERHDLLKVQPKVHLGKRERDEEKVDLFAPKKKRAKIDTEKKTVEPAKQPGKKPAAPSKNTDVENAAKKAAAQPGGSLDLSMLDEANGDAEDGNITLDTGAGGDEFLSLGAGAAADDDDEEEEEAEEEEGLQMDEGENQEPQAETTNGADANQIEEEEEDLGFVEDAGDLFVEDTQAVADPFAVDGATENGEVAAEAQQADGDPFVVDGATENGEVAAESQEADEDPFVVDGATENGEGAAEAQDDPYAVDDPYS